MSNSTALSARYFEIRPHRLNYIPYIEDSSIPFISNHINLIAVKSCVFFTGNQRTRMEYTKTFNELKTIFNSGKKEISIPGSDIKIHNISFRSELTKGFSNATDTAIYENLEFSYPVFSPADKKSDKVILLLHGLNERSWIKYLVWAFYLAKNTNSYVILFPISFHINRSPADWKDPRAMMDFMNTRNSAEKINMSSFANIALSNRLTEDPMRFFKSGYQTSNDIEKLLASIRDGKHELIPSSCKFNIFAYSIGAFLAQIIMMGNPDQLFSDSKLFILCGGSVFSNMQGSSKLIMDKAAFDKVYNYYLYDFEETLTGKSTLVDYLSSNQIGIAFRSMIDLGRLKSFRENVLNKLKGQIHSLSLMKDSVIPCKGVISTLHTPEAVEIWDFPFPYTHENPFPVFNSPLSSKVDYWFEKVFAKATVYLG